VADLELTEGKTKVLHARLEEMGLLNALFVNGDSAHDAPAFMRASKNIPWVHLLSGLRTNVVELLRRQDVVLTKQAVQHFEKRLLR